MGSPFHVGMVTENVAVMALMQTLSPMLIAVLAGPLLGERLGPTQWLGLVLGATGVIIGADVTQTGRKPIGKDERRIVARSSVSSSDRGGMQRGATTAAHKKHKGGPTGGRLGGQGVGGRRARAGGTS